MVLKILFELGFEGMLIILEADSEQLALQLVVALVEQIFRGVVGGRLGLFALGMCDDGLGLVFCMLYHYYFIEEAKGKMEVMLIEGKMAMRWYYPHS